ncbi:hypothetical protein [Oceanithermus sp.]
MDDAKAKIEAARARARELGQAVRVDGNSKCSLYAWPDGALRDDMGREWSEEDAVYMLENIATYREQDT